MDESTRQLLICIVIMGLLMLGIARVFGQQRVIPIDEPLPLVLEYPAGSDPVLVYHDTPAMARAKSRAAELENRIWWNGIQAWLRGPAGNFTANSTDNTAVGGGVGGGNHSNSDRNSSIRDSHSALGTNVGHDDGGEMNGFV
jgi:hypothetical protein